jgi:LysM repeat protein
MSKKTIIYILFILILSVALSACERSASTAPLGTPSEVPVAGEATSSDPMEMLRSFATQTAQALSGTTQPSAPAVGTSQPGAIVTTPLSLPTVAVATQTPITGTAVPSTNTKPTTYALQEGEYPYCIARRFDVNPDELLNLNGLGSGGQYYSGLVLKIPQSGNPFPPPRSLRTRPVASYTVASGESIYAIACKFGDIDPITIASANNLVAPYTLKTGQVISIP